MCGTKFFSPSPGNYSFMDTESSLIPHFKRNIYEFIRIKSKKVLKYSFFDLFGRRMSYWLSPQLCSIGMILKII